VLLAAPFILLSLSSQVGAQPQAPIASVVVFADRAQVTRVQAVDCAAGEARFAGLPSTIDPKSLWATLEGKGAGTVVGVTHKEEPTGPRPQAEALQKQVRELDEKLVARAGEVDAAGALERKLSSFRSHLHTLWSRQATGAKPPLPSWDAALDLLRQQVIAAAGQRRRAQESQRELRRERERLVQDLQTIDRERRRTTFSVTAVLQCQGRQKVRLSYVVPGATWRIAYQLRAEMSPQTVTLAAQAVVQQGTGEDWTDAALSVTTANLQRQNTPPTVERMRLGGHEPESTRKILSRRFEHREHLVVAEKAGYRVDAAKLRSKTTPLGAESAEPSSPPEQGLAMVLPAAQRVTVPSDGREVLATLDRRTFRASFGLETVPKLFPYVYHRVALKNPFAFPMLPGKVEIYRGRAFVGQAAMKLRAPGEPFAFSLGVESQVQVKRWVKREALEGPGALGSKKKLLHRYTIQVGNWTRQPRRVRVLENLPVSQVRDIEVSLADGATNPSAWNRPDGILTYDLDLPPRNQKVITVGYTVTLPEAYEVQGY
jgi:uncharacterized protein (TIGR02231 family)